MPHRFLTVADSCSSIVRQLRRLAFNAYREHVHIKTVLESIFTKATIKRTSVSNLSHHYKILSNKDAVGRSGGYATTTSYDDYRKALKTHFPQHAQAM